MNKTKHFMRTAFNLSAKSMVSTLLLLIAMLLPQGAWAENFISEIKIGANSNQNTAKGYLSGYKPIDKDLNYGNGSNSLYIYLGYKTDTDASKAITGIMIVSGAYLGDEYLEDGTKTLSYDGKTWYRSPAQGAADINKGAGGDDLTIFYTRDGNTVNGGKPLVSLSVAEETGLSGYTYAGLYKNGAFSANGSTNVGTKGAARYITYTTHTHSYTTQTTPATCAKTGLRKSTCSCGAVTEEVLPIDADAHNFGTDGICKLNNSHFQKPSIQMGLSGYVIANYGNLRWFCDFVNSGNYDADAYQTADITATGVWPCIKKFSGTYDGKGHTIKNLTLPDDNSISLGFFITLDGARVANLGFVNINLPAPPSRTNSSFAYELQNKSVIENCFALINNQGGACGICHTVNNSTIRNCYTRFAKDGGHGIAYTVDNEGTVSNCYSNREIQCSSSNSEGNVTDADFASGRITVLLNESQLVWYQKLGSDAYPVLTNTGDNTVWQLNNYMCDGKTPNGTYSYTNDINGQSTAPGTHNWTETTKYIKTPATCIGDAVYYYECSLCHTSSENLTGESYALKYSWLGHELEEHDGKYETCEEDGMSAYYYCTRCEKIYGSKDKYAEKVYTMEELKRPATGHKFTNYVYNNDGSCTKNGTKTARCENYDINKWPPTRCSKKETIEDPNHPATGVHTFTKKTLTASPVEDGLYAFACDYSCGTHSDDHVIKDFNGAGNHLALTKSGSAYSTSENITLIDGNPFASPVDFTANSATYSRTMPNQWGTIVVPFGFNADESDDYDFYTLTGATSEQITLTKVENGDAVAAGTPLIVRMKDGTALSLAANNTTVSGQFQEGSASDGLKLVGTYDVTTLTANDYFISNNKFWRTGDMSAPVKAAPFRAYLKNTTGSAMASALNIAIEDDSATAIDVLNMLNDADAEYYDLNGRRIPQLQNGINIVKYGNGKTKKVSIK